MRPQNLQERKNFQGITHEIHNFSKINILEEFFVSNTIVSDGTVSRMLFWKRGLTEFCPELGEF